MPIFYNITIGGRGLPGPQNCNKWTAPKVNDDKSWRKFEILSATDVDVDVDNGRDNLT